MNSITTRLQLDNIFATEDKELRQQRSRTVVVALGVLSEKFRVHDMSIWAKNILILFIIYFILNNQGLNSKI